MKNKKILLVIGVIFLLNCANGFKDKKFVRSKTENVFVFQNGKERLIQSNNQIVEIEKNEFSIRMFQKKYDADRKEFNTVQIVVYTKPKMYNELEEGLVTDFVPCLFGGTGGAADKNGYHTIFPCNLYSGHHYLFYKNEDEKRLNLLDDFNEELKLEFPVYSIYISNNEIEFIDADIEKLYFAVFIDRNDNDVIDTNELTKFIVKFID